MTTVTSRQPVGAPNGTGGQFAPTHNADSPVRLDAANGYEQACTRAATSQGLDPVVSTLRDAGANVTVEQTGGMCMAATVPCPGGVVTVIDDTADPDASQRRYLVAAYPGTGWDDGEPESDVQFVTGTDQMQAQVRTMADRFGGWQ